MSSTTSADPLADILEAHRRNMTLPAYRDWKARQQREPAIDPDAIEKDEQREVMRIYRAHGCIVRNLSQARRTKQAPGLPDLWVVHRGKGKAWWHETKRSVGGRYSPAQLEFKADCALAEIPWVGGDRRAAVAKLRAIGVEVDL